MCCRIFIQPPVNSLVPESRAFAGVARYRILSIVHHCAPNRYLRLRIPGGEGVDVGEHTVAGAIVAEGGLVFRLDYGKCIQQVARVFARQACVQSQIPRCVSRPAR